MISQSALEEAILALLCFHDDIALKIAPQIESERLFSTNRTNEEIAKHALEYVKKYGTSPGMALEYVLENRIQKGGEAGKLVGQQIEFLSKRVTEIDATFVLDQLERFLEVQHLQLNLQSALEHLDQGELEQAREAVFKFDSKNKNGQAAINFTDPKSLHVLDKIDTDDYFSCGVEIFDRLGIRLGRKMLGFIIAPKGDGKSWWLINVGRAGIQHHHKVLHITLELSQEKTYFRYLQTFFSLTKREIEQVRIPIFNRDDTGKFVSMNFGEMTRYPVFQKREELYQKLQAMYHSHLIIKEFPTGTLTMEALRMYLEQLKREEGFEPDLLLLDYADLMFVNPAQLRIDTGRVYVNLRGLAIEKNCAIATATQSNREGAESKNVRSTNVAEDFSKVMTADLVLTMSKTPQERLMNLARVFAAHARDEDDKKTALISQAYRIGQFSLDSVLMNPEVGQALTGATEVQSS